MSTSEAMDPSRLTIPQSSNSIGAIPSPFDCWLVLGGLKTLSLRMARHSSNAMTVARYL